MKPNLPSCAQELTKNGVQQVDKKSEAPEDKTIVRTPAASPCRGPVAIAR